MSEDERVTQIENVILPILTDYGLELVAVEWRGHGPRGVLRVFIDKPGGVELRDLERVSRQVGDVLDVADLIPERYDLEVSSPGLDRNLKSDREFRWALGKRIRCGLLDGGEVCGRLVEVHGDRLVVDSGDGGQDVPRDDVRKARLDPEVAWRRQA